MKPEFIYFYGNLFTNATINTEIQKNKYHSLGTVLAISQSKAWPSLFPYKMKLWLTAC